MTSKQDEKTKPLLTRLPKDLWVFMKKASVHYEMPMNHIVINCLQRYREKMEKKLDKF